jgi:Flp pilus assembly protein CpaB
MGSRSASQGTHGPNKENAVKGGNKLFIFTGAALALVAVLLAITMTSGDKNVDANTNKADNDKTTIVKAGLDFAAHQVVQPSDIVTEQVKTSEVPAGAITDPSAIIGQAYQLNVIKGDVLYVAYVEAPGLSSQVSPGMRAASLSVDTQGMMSGLVMDGDYIDIVFKARVDLRRIINIIGVEVEEDGPYTLQDATKQGDSTGNAGSSDSSSDNSDGESDQPNVPLLPNGETIVYQGKPGGEFTAVDAGSNLEPVAKILIQNVKVIRVVPPGVKYDGQGQQIAQNENDTQTLETNGQLILEVTPEQAEALAFIQDQNHSYEILVRGEEDTAIAKTSGVTFNILMTDKQWSLPWPKPIAVPAEDE